MKPLYKRKVFYTKKPLSFAKRFSYKFQHIISKPINQFKSRVVMSNNIFNFAMFMLQIYSYNFNIQRHFIKKEKK